jgi:MFS family permease
MNTSNQEPPYAWVMVGAVFVCLGVIFGVCYSFAAYFAAFSQEFSAQRADVSLVFGLMGLVHFSLGALGGMASDRFGPRRVAVAGMLFIAAGLWVCAHATRLDSVYLAYGAAIGLGIALVYTPSIGALQPWFTARRGLAGGLASAGIGAGTLVVPLLASFTMTQVSWRQSLQWMAVAVLIVGVGAAWLLKRAPMLHTAAGSAAKPGMALSQTVKDARFKWLYVAVLLGAFPMFIPFAHVSAAARDAGIGQASAVALVGVIGVGSLTGRFAIGGLADKLGRHRSLVLLQLSMGLSYGLWLVAEGYWSFFVFALWLGISYGGIVSLLPALCMDMFGARAVSGIIGTLYTGAALGNLMGPVAAGAVFDSAGEYAPVLWACMVLALLATLASVRLARLPGPRF